MYNHEIIDLLERNKDLAIKHQAELIDLFFDDFFEFAYANIVDIHVSGEQTVVKIEFKSDGYSEMDECVIDTLCYLNWCDGYE
jgi:hypothetical protein